MRIFYLLLFLTLRLTAQPPPVFIPLLRLDTLLPSPPRIQTWPIVDTFDYKAKQVACVTNYRDGVKIETRYYDPAGRIIRSIDYWSEFESTWNYLPDGADEKITRSTKPSSPSYSTECTKNGLHFLVFANETDSMFSCSENDSVLYSAYFRNGILVSLDQCNYFPNGKRRFYQRMKYNETETWIYNANGKPLRYVISAGPSRSVFDYAYDGRGNLTTEIIRDGSGNITDSTGIIYNRHGQVMEKISISGMGSSYKCTTDERSVYDRSGRLITRKRIITNAYACDTSEERNVYYGNGKDHTCYSNARSQAEKIIYRYENNSVSITTFLPLFTSLDSAMQNDSLFIPIEERVTTADTFHRLVTWRIFDQGKWKEIYSETTDSAGHPKLFFNNILNTDPYLPAGIFHSTSTYDSSGRLTAFCISDTAGKNAFTCTRQFSSTGKLQQITSSAYFRNDTAFYDDTGRMTYLSQGHDSYAYGYTANSISDIKYNVSGYSYDWVMEFENGLPVKNKTTSIDINGRKSETLYTWQYEYYK